jgi:hypothetical protein
MDGSVFYLQDRRNIRIAEAIKPTVEQKALGQIKDLGFCIVFHTYSLPLRISLLTSKQVCQAKILLKIPAKNSYEPRSLLRIVKKDIL